MSRNSRRRYFARRQGRITRQNARNLAEQINQLKSELSDEREATMTWKRRFNRARTEVSLVRAREKYLKKKVNQLIEFNNEETSICWNLREEISRLNREIERLEGNCNNRGWTSE
ncbi:8931_t:CDS:2 [Funneliformis mosseae]|uniref:8931_t:CDS:1 n=1 Tax=Funneliformis mosseae TaxID=27381 RepID=A0A9N8Z9Q3_FUNMO|nr:8931_t:CDS:2 [Funneliformis mosseae]